MAFLQRIGWGLALIGTTAALVLMLKGVLNIISVEMVRHQVKGLMQTIQEARGSDLVTRLDALAQLSAGLSDSAPFEKAMAETKADAQALVYYYRAQGEELSSTPMEPRQIIEEYQSALEIKPRDGSLWARYAFFLRSTQQRDTKEDLQDALLKALKYGAFDYNTMRSVGEMGIRSWPVLDCSLRVRIVELLERAENIDDHLLSRWNTQLGQKSLATSLKEWYESYGFNLKWAKRSVISCDT